MPFQVMVQDRSGENIARGIESMGQAIARGMNNVFERMQKEKDREKMEGKLANGMRSTLKQLDALEAQKAGREPNPSQFDKMDYYQAKSAWDAIGMKNTLEEHAQHRELVAEQIARMKRDGRNAAAFPGFVKRVGEMGQAPADVPSVVSPEAYARRTAPVTQQRIMQAMGEAGYDPGAQNFDDILRAFMPKEREGWNLDIGQIVEGGGRKGMAVSPNSIQLFEEPTEKEGGAPAANYPWLYSDDEKEVMGALQQLSPAEMKRAVAARAAIKRMEGKADPMQRLIEALEGMGSGGGGGRAGAGAPAAKPYDYQWKPGGGLTPFK